MNTTILVIIKIVITIVFLAIAFPLFTGFMESATNGITKPLFSIISIVAIIAGLIGIWRYKSKSDATDINLKK